MRTLSSLLALALFAAPAFAQERDVTLEAKVEYQKKLVIVGNPSEIDSVALYQGKARRELSEPAFFELAGRPELADWYRRRQILKISLIAGGLGLVLAGAIWAGTSFASAVCAPPSGPQPQLTTVTNTCAPKSQVPPILLMLAGGGTIGVGALLTSHPVDAAELRTIAEGYNANLRRSLGLAPFAAARGGGVTAFATF